MDFDKKKVHAYVSKQNTHRYVPVSDTFLARLKIMKANSQTKYSIEGNGKHVKSIKKGIQKGCQESRDTLQGENVRPAP